MKTPMNVFNTAMKKKKKNRKGFSLVELIVVLVIMAILAAALVPTLIGYIKQTRQSNAKNEAASCVSAAQTMASSAYASGDGKYYDQSSSTAGTAIQILTADNLDEGVSYTDADDKDETPQVTTIEKLAEVDKADGDVTSVTFEKGVVTQLKYVDKSGVKVVYNSSGANKGYTIES